MSAVLPPGPVPDDQRSDRIPIPRYTNKQLERIGRGLPAREVAQNVNQLALSIGSRFSNLPPFDPKESDDDIRKKLDERFTTLRLMAREAADGNVRALIASGPGGVGKTFEMEDELDTWQEEADNHFYTPAKGYVRATDLYRLLYENRYPSSCLMFDDADTVFFDETALNLLKIACDTTQDRVPRWGSEAVISTQDGDPIPRSFDFEGSVIFITNIDFDLQISRANKLAPHMEALMTRAHYIDLGMKTQRDYLIRIYQVCEKGLLSNIGLSIPEENGVLTFIEDNLPRLRELSLRMALKIGSLRKTNSHIGWQRIAELTCCRNAR